MYSEDKIPAYVNRAFRGVVQTEKVQEAKEALCADLLEKYRELIREGSSPESAYQITISSVGDIFELVDSVAEEEELVEETEEEAGEDLGESFPARWAHVLPFAAVGLFILFWLMESLNKPGPGREKLLPLLVVGAAAGAAAAWFLLDGRKRPMVRERKSVFIILCVIWAAAAVLFLWSMGRPRMERIIWLIPIGALALHQMCTAWFAYRDSEEGGAFHE